MIAPRPAQLLVGELPEDVIEATTPLTGTRPNEGRVSRGTLPGISFPNSITTGPGSPLGVAINSSGTRAYVAVGGAIDVIDLATNTPSRPSKG